MSTTTLPLNGHARDIATHLLLNGPSSRTDLAAALNLSAGSLTRLTKPLLESQLIFELPATEPATGLGRPSVPLAFNLNAHRFIGVKLTATHAYAALTRADSHIEKLVRTTLPTDTIQGALNTITGLITELAAASPHPVLATGITLGGHVENHRTITHADHLGWDHLNLADHLEQTTGIQTIVENDIVAHTELTHWFGEGSGTETFALITIGAGIGYGLITHGRVVTSTEAGYSLASHLPLMSKKLSQYQTELTHTEATHPSREHTEGTQGSTTLQTDLFTAPCGHQGCATAMLTISLVEQRATTTLGRTVTFDQLLGLAQAGDPTALLLVDASGYALGTLLGAISNLTMPQRIVIGGEAVGLATTAHQAVLDGLHNNRDPRAQDPEIRYQNPDLALWTQSAALVAMHSTLIGR